MQIHASYFCALCINIWMLFSVSVSVCFMCPYYPPVIPVARAGNFQLLLACPALFSCQLLHHYLLAARRLSQLPLRIAARTPASHCPLQVISTGVGP